MSNGSHRRSRMRAETPRRKWKETPRAQDKKHLCRYHFQQKEIRFRRVGHRELQFQSNQQPKHTPEGQCQPGERPITTSTTELINLEMKSRGQNKPKKLEFGAWPLHSSFRMWKMQFRSEIARSSDRPTQAVPWINKIEVAKDMNDRATSNSNSKVATGDVETLVSKIASG